MRIIQEFNIDHYKCTLFHHNEKYTLQVEDTNYLIQFKLGGCTSEQVNNIQSTMKHSKLKYQIEKSFSRVHDNRIVLDSLLMSQEEESLPDII